QRDSRSHVTHDKFRAGRAMGGSARVALSYLAADGSELYRIQPRTGEGRDGDDGITGRKLPAAAGADYRKESHASSRSPSRYGIDRECPCECMSHTSAFFAPSGARRL